MTDVTEPETLPPTPAVPATEAATPAPAAPSATASAPGEEKAPEDDKEPEEPALVLVDFSKATIRFSIPTSMAPKHPKRSIRTPLPMPCYSRRVRTEEYERYIADMMEVYIYKVSKNLELTDEDRRGFSQTLGNGLDLRGDALDRALEREGSEWTNRPVDKTGVGVILPGIPEAPKVDENEVAQLSGSAAIYFAIRGAQSGSPALMPFWHSGIRIEQNPPTNERVALMHERIAADKIIGGRNTAGYIFSATSVISMKHAVELALECVYQSNVPGLSVAKLMDVIPITDLPALLLNTMTAMNPYGYPYTQGCYQSPEVCTYTVTDTLSIPKLYQVDNSSITPRMREIMSDSPELTPALQAEYSEELRKGVNAKHDSSKLNLSGNGNVILNLAVPSIAKSIKYGERWLNDIALDIKDVLSNKNLSADARERIVTERQFYSWMRQYEAWISSLYVNANGTMREVAAADIPNVLGQLSRDSDLRVRYMDGVMQFIADNSIALAAMPAWVCPACNKDAPAELLDSKYYDLIPIDVAQVFFTLNSIQALMENLDEVI